MRQAERDAATTLDDAAIIERSLAEPDRFAVLFDRHAPRIHRYIARDHRAGQARSGQLGGRAALIRPAAAMIAS